jgi:sugar lactone lactonase YvrE
VVADRLLGQVRGDQVVSDLVDRDGLNGPRAVALDEGASPAHLYVVDAFNHRVLGWADAEGFRNGQPADLILGQPDRWSSRCNNGGRSLRSLCLSPFVAQGIAVDHRGTVWVADGGNARVLGYRSPFDEDAVADLLLGQPDAGSGSCGAGKERLCYPGGVAVDGDGNVFVAELLKNLILEYDDPLRRGTSVDRVLGAGRPRFCNGPTICFSAPHSTHPGYDHFGGSLATDDRGRLLVGNLGRVWVIERPLARRPSPRELVDLGPLAAPFDDPEGLAVDEAGQIYVSARRLYVFSRGGDGPLRTLGEPCTYGHSTGLPEGFGPQSLCAATGLALSRHGELFVADAAVHRVVVFGPP